MRGALYFIFATMLSGRVAILESMAQAQPSTEPASAMTGIAAELQSRLNAGGFPSLCVGVVANGEVVFREGFGFADIGKKTAPTPTTLYRIGSVTKVFTSTLLVALREKGLITLDDPIAKFLPQGSVLPTDPRGESAIRLWHLATHTSGLSRLPVNLDGTADQPYARFTTARLLEGLALMRLERPTGAKVSYSNLGVALLGHVLERAGGKPYEALLRDEILLPLQMNNSVLAPTPAIQPRVAIGYDSNGRPQPDWDMAAMAPAGGLYSSLEDMLRFVAWQLRSGQANVHPLSGGDLRLMQAPHAVDSGRKMAIGLGWILKSGPRESGDIVWHNGMTAVYASYVGLSPKMGVGVVVLTNKAASVDEIGEWLLGAAVKLWGKAATVELDPKIEALARELMKYMSTEPGPGLSELFSAGFLAQVPIEQVQSLLIAKAAAHGACRSVEFAPGDSPMELIAVYHFERGPRERLWLAVDAGREPRIAGLRLLGPEPEVELQPVVTTAPASQP